MKKNVTTTIEITDSHVKIIQSQIIKGQRAVSFCGVKAIKSYTDSDIIKAINELIASKNMNFGKVIFVIPRRFSILKRMDLPSENTAEIKKMIGLQLVSQLPYALDDVNFEFHILEKEKKGYSSALVFIIHKDVHERYSKLLNKVGITSENLVLSSFGIWAWVYYQETKKVIDMSQSIAIVDIDAVSSEICFFQKGHMLFSRNMNCGVGDLNEESVGGLIKQIGLSLRAYKNEKKGPDIEKLYILSPIEDATFLRSRFEEGVDMKVSFLSPLQNVLCKKNIDLSPLKGSSGVSLTVSSGLHFGEEGKRINLIPKEIVDIKATKIIKSLWIRFIVLSSFMLLLVGGSFGVQVFKKNTYLNKIKKEVARVRAEAKKVDKNLRFVDAIKDEFSGRTFVADMLREIIRLTPEEISFRSLTLNESGNLAIQGYAQENTSINIFQAGLVKSPFFNNVNLQFATKRKTYNMEVTDFKINMQVSKKEGKNIE